ncbi:MAG TPA: DUF2628 domain-containing protein [Pseudolabrys sp.]|nr:DUF2628 domain-containing protein [Pseudolabrys sp.]
MSVYTVHQPPLKAGETAVDPDRFVFVRDRFAVWAFLLPPLWLLIKRLWLVFILYLLLLGVVGAILYAADIGPPARSLVVLAISFLVGLEAATLQRWTLARRKWTQIGVVVADDREAAERRFFAGWVARQAPPPMAEQPPLFSPPVINPPRPRSEPHPLGLFPQPGGGR